VSTRLAFSQSNGLAFETRDNVVESVSVVIPLFNEYWSRIFDSVDIFPGYCSDQEDIIVDFGTVEEYYPGLDDGGVYTDSAEFVDIIEECTNLSVGYFSEHTTSEKQDIDFLELLDKTKKFAISFTTSR